MKPRLIAALGAFAIAGAASAQTATPMDQTPLFAQASRHTHAGSAHVEVDGVPPLPPACIDGLPKPPPRPPLPDFTQDKDWQQALGITDAQARQVQQTLAQQDAQRRKIDEQRRKDDEALCAKVRGIVGEKAMSRWSDLMLPPPPPPLPPMPPGPPAPPSPPGVTR
jgi:hypothetical protein